MRTLSLLARKGGAGKTTLACHLAVMAGAKGIRTLLVDCDPQQSATEWWKARPGESPELVTCETRQVRDAVHAAREGGVGLVIVDTRPSAERDTVDVANVSDLALVPCQPSILDLRAIGATVDVLKLTKRPAAVVLNSCPAGRGGAEAALTTEARQGLAEYGLPVAPVSITRRAAFAHALIDGRAVNELEPDGKAAGELLTLWQWTEGQLWQRSARG